MRELRQASLRGAWRRVRRGWTGALLATPAPYRHVPAPGLRAASGGLRAGGGSDLRVRRGRGVWVVREARLRRPLGRVRGGWAAALRHPPRATGRRNRLVRLCGTPQGVPRGRPGVLAEGRGGVPPVRPGRPVPASRRVRPLRAERADD